MSSFQALKTSFPSNDFETASFNGDPLFVDAAAADYRLTNTSPAKGRGSDGEDLGADLTLVGPAARVDAGVVDAGVVDAGVVDAGAVDAGAVDAGGAADAGASMPLSPVTGCGCGAVGPEGLFAWVIFLRLLKRPGTAALRELQ